MQSSLTINSLFIITFHHQALRHWRGQCIYKLNLLIIACHWEPIFLNCFELRKKFLFLIWYIMFNILCRAWEIGSIVIRYIHSRNKSCEIILFWVFLCRFLRSCIDNVPISILLIILNITDSFKVFYFAVKIFKIMNASLFSWKR